jgi:hypothetical protein
MLHNAIAAFQNNVADASFRSVSMAVQVADSNIRMAFQMVAGSPAANVSVHINLVSYKQDAPENISGPNPQSSLAIYPQANGGPYQLITDDVTGSSPSIATSSITYQDGANHCVRPIAPDPNPRNPYLPAAFHYQPTMPVMGAFCRETPLNNQSTDFGSVTGSPSFEGQTGRELVARPYPHVPQPEFSPSFAGQTGKQLVSQPYPHVPPPEFSPSFEGQTGKGVSQPYPHAPQPQPELYDNDVSSTSNATGGVGWENQEEEPVIPEPPPEPVARSWLWW